MRKPVVFLSIIAAVIIIALLYFWPPFYNTEIKRTGDGVVLVKDLPPSDKLRLQWWKQNKHLLEKDHALIPDQGYFSLSIMDFGKGYEKLPAEDFISGISQDDYLCFDSIKSETKCVKKNELMSIMGDVTKKIFIYIGDRQYIQLPDGTIKEQQIKDE